MMLANYDNNNNSERDASLLQAHHNQRLLYYYHTNHTDAEWHDMIGEILGSCLGDRNKKKTPQVHPTMIARRVPSRYDDSNYRNADRAPQVPPTISDMQSRPHPRPQMLIHGVINEPLHIVISFIDQGGRGHVVVEKDNWDLGFVKFPYWAKVRVGLNLRNVERNLNGFNQTVNVVYEKLLQNKINGKRYLVIKYDVENMDIFHFLLSLENYFGILNLNAIPLIQIKNVFYSGQRIVKFEDMTRQMFDQVILSEKPASLLLSKHS